MKHFSKPGFAVQTIVVVATAFISAAPAQQPLPVGSQKQLLIDCKLIESSEGIQLMAQEPFQTREKLVTADQSWEAGASLGSYSTVIKEGDTIRLWYDIRAGAPPPGQKNPAFMGIAYAESRDGIHFTKPVLNLVELNGSKENNFVMPPDPAMLAVGGGSVWRDDNPACPAEARYKSWVKIYPRNASVSGVPSRIFTSPDGIHWKLDERQMTGLRAVDTQPSWFWEPRIRRYIGYSREWIREKSGFGFRAFSYNESDDLFQWDNMAMALEPDERDCAATPAMRIDVRRLEVRGDNIMPQRATRTAAVEGGEDQVLTPAAPLDFYGPGVFPYEGVYLALVSVFHHWKGSANEAWPNTGDVQLAVSRDGRHFTRPGNRQPFLRTGPDGSWDSKWIYPVLRPIRMGDQLWIYYFGMNSDHAARLDAQATVKETAISRAILRLDGFVAAVADYTGGVFITPPLRFEGTRLELNLDTGAGGSALVELLDENGKPIPGFGFHDADERNGNSVQMPVTWRGNADVSALAGQSIRLHVRLRNAKLYAFQFLQ
jgi:hypothetical protein